MIPIFGLNLKNELITQSALLNHGGGLRKDHGIVFTDPVYWANYMYSTQEGTIPITVFNNTPVFASSGKYIIKRKDIPLVDAMALMEEGRKSCTVFLCNRSFDAGQKVNINIENFVVGREASLMMIQSKDIALRNSWENPENVYPVFQSVNTKKGEIT